MSNPPAPTPDGIHPLERDLDRLERIVDVMWAEIHKVLHRTPPSRRRAAGSAVARVLGDPVSERLIEGSASPTDILSEAVAALLLTPEDKVATSWEAVAVGIARNKAKGALRAGQAGLRGTEHRPKLTVVSGDQPGPSTGDGDPTPTVFELIQDDALDPEAEFLATSQQIELLRLARDILDDRDRTIFLALHFEERTRTSLAEEFGLTGPGVTHVYRTVAQRLYEHPRFQQYAEGGTP